MPIRKTTLRRVGLLVAAVIVSAAIFSPQSPEPLPTTTTTTAAVAVPLVNEDDIPPELPVDPYRWASVPAPILDGPVAVEQVEWVWLIHFSGHGDRSRAVWNTWARRFDPRVAIVAFGTPVPGHVPRHATIVTAVDQAGDAWSKTLHAFRAARRLYPSAIYYSKFDDDSYIYSKNLYRRLFTEPGKIKYGGYPLRSGGVIFASGGAGYSVHRSKMSILEQCPDQGLSEYEDLAMRKCLEIDPTDLVGAHPHHPWQMLRWDKEGHSEDHVRLEEPDISYTEPLSYHYMSPDELERMHDDWHVAGFPSLKRTRGIPKIMHQFWVGTLRPPTFALESCRDLHPQWTHTLWNDELIRARFPFGQLLNQAEYSRPHQEFNLLSDIARYEFLMQFGGVYVDADTHCLQPLDFLWRDLYVDPVSNLNEGACAYESEEHAANVEGHQLVATGVLAMRPFSPTAMLLVKYLYKTDWTRQAWVSAGPLFATRLFKRLNSPLTYLPSRLFYPFHHLDKRPSSTDEVYKVLRDKGALMDQFWGTSHYSYPSDQAPTTPAETLALMQNGGEMPAMTTTTTSRLGRLLDDYAKFHLRSLSPVNRRRPRWLVVPPSTTGTCHLASALLLAVATRRTLLFQKTPESMNRSPRLMFSYAKALQYYGWTHADVRNETRSADLHDRDFLAHLRHRDMDQAYPQSILFIQRFDGWGSLLLANPVYQRRLFGDLTPQEAFPLLFQFLSLSDIPECEPVQVVVAEIEPRYESTAWVYPMHDASVVAVAELRRSLTQLHVRFNHRFHYPIVLLVDNVLSWEWIQTESPARIHLAQSQSYLQRFDRIIQLDYRWSVMPETSDEWFIDKT